MEKNEDAVFTQWKEELPPSLGEVEEKKDSKEALLSTQYIPVRSLLHTLIHPTLLQSCRVAVFALGWGCFVFWFCVCF